MYGQLTYVDFTDRSAVDLTAVLGSNIVDGARGRQVLANRTAFLAVTQDELNGNSQCVLLA
jgi:hypothetical protein